MILSIFAIVYIIGFFLFILFIMNLPSDAAKNISGGTAVIFCVIWPVVVLTAIFWTIFDALFGGNVKKL